MPGRRAHQTLVGSETLALVTCIGIGTTDPTNASPGIGARFAPSESIVDTFKRLHLPGYDSDGRVNPLCARIGAIYVGIACGVSEVLASEDLETAVRA